MILSDNDGDIHRATTTKIKSWHKIRISDNNDTYLMLYVSLLKLEYNYNQNYKIAAFENNFPQSKM